MDEFGNAVDGDAVIGLAARQLHRVGKLSNDGVAVTVMSNLALDGFLKREGVSTVTRTQVGDRYVVEAMRNKDSVSVASKAATETSPLFPHLI